MIYQDIEEVQYLDYKVLAQIMLETEPDLFSDAHPCPAHTPCENALPTRVQAGINARCTEL